MRLGSFALVLALSSGVAVAKPAAPTPGAPTLAGIAVTGAPSPDAATAIADGVATAIGHRGDTPGRCVTPQCLGAVLTSTSGERGVGIAIEVSGEFHDRFAVTVRVVDRDGRVLRRRTETCETCSVAEAIGRVRGLVTAVGDAATDDEVAVEIATAPIAAPITIDGTAAGSTPWSGTLVAGAHTVVIGSASHDVFVEATGEPVQLSFDVAVTYPKPSLLRFAPYAAAGVGVLAIGLGGYLISVDGDPTCPHPSCPEVRDTSTGGWVGVGVGVVALGAAGYLYWRGRDRERPMLALVPSVNGGATAVAVGRF